MICKIKDCAAEIVRREEPFTMGGTAIVEMQRVWCAAGHWYHEVLNIIDDPAKP